MVPEDSRHSAIETWQHRDKKEILDIKKYNYIWDRKISDSTFTHSHLSCIVEVL